MPSIIACSDVSIVICTYNRAVQLKKTLDSVLKLGNSFVEIIVVDNNSIDNTAAVVESYTTCKKVRYVQETQQGIAYARNRGLEECKTRYLAFLDDDETVEPHWLTSMFAGFEMNPDVVVVAGPTIPIFEAPPPSWLPEGLHDAYRFLPDQRYVLDKTAGIGTGNVLINMNYVGDVRFKTSVGRTGSVLLGGEDVDFFYRLLSEERCAVYVPDAIVYHHISKEKLTLKWHIRRYFYEGITEYLFKGGSIIPKRIPKLFLDCLGIFIALLSFNRKRASYKFFRLCQTVGILSGPGWLWRKNR